MHLRLRQRSGNGFGATNPDLVLVEIEAGQRPVEQNIQGTNIFDREQNGEYWSNRTKLKHQVSSVRMHLRLR